MSPRTKLAGMLAATLLACATAAQQAEPPKKPAPPEKQAEAETPAVLPAAVLRFAGKMEESAPAEFLKWGRAYAKREMFDHATPRENEAVSKALAAHYPKAPAAARTAGLFLLWYLAYQEADKAQQVSGQRVRDADREIDIMEDDLRRIRNMPVRMEDVDRVREEEARIQFRLETAVRVRELQKHQLESVQARVDACLARLTALYESLKDRDPAAIRQLL